MKINVKADGSDQKVTGSKEFDTLAVKQVDDKTAQFTRKKDGKVVGESIETVSADGKTLTQEFKFYPMQGEPVTGKTSLSRADPVCAGDAPARAVRRRHAGHTRPYLRSLYSSSAASCRLPSNHTAYPPTLAPKRWPRGVSV